MDTVAIVGVGLIGGSFALAIREAGFRGAILGVSSPATLAKALELGVIDEGVDLEAACRRADLVYLAQPILAILDTLARIGDWVRPDALVTDAGSTKARIVAQAIHHVHNGVFLGGHPMAGKESRGVEAAEAGLFRGRPYALTPSQDNELGNPRAQELTAWIEKIGAEVVILRPEAHDSIVSYSSHLPQLLSTALAVTLSEQPDTAKLAGPGVLDLTRLALSPFEVWRDILVTNPAHIRVAIDLLTAKLQYLKDNLEEQAMEEQFATAAVYAGMLRRRL